MTKQKKTGAKAEPTSKAAGSKNPSNAAKTAGSTPLKTTPKKKK
ncbi:hypothetical protein [Pleurocapsa sp. FMAR1]|nr:hypothetical protein [Pleurocapsa sp. FMAR1]